MLLNQERRKTLESELQRLTMLERREEQLRSQLDEKTQQIRQYTASLSVSQNRNSNATVSFLLENAMLVVNHKASVQVTAKVKSSA